MRETRYNFENYVSDVIDYFVGSKRPNQRLRVETVGWTRQVVLHPKMANLCGLFGRH